MSEHAAPAHDHHEHEHHVSSVKTLLSVLIILLILTVLTVYTAIYVDIGDTGNLILALFIAFFKASLVCAFFMHLLYDKAMNNVVLAYCAMTIGLFFLFTVIDMSSRDWVDPIRKEATQAPMVAQEARERAIAEGRLSVTDEGDDANGSH